MPLQALALLRAGVLSGEYYEATNEEGELVGYTMWMPPGQEMFSTEEQKQLGLYEFMAKLSDEAKEYYRTKGKLDSWWLHMAMIRRDYQRQGVLRALLSPVREKAAAAGQYLATCTTNDDNIHVYTGLGFDFKGSTVISSPWGDWPIHVFKMDWKATPVTEEKIE
ncbi:hypothetical protein NLJ89_g4046 [Agrocybe chaxingu]|uniref:N-acetyltransferase domain-containing protein n=1 Tax=Agrocybe chaxingu TaxID=84603 RepID=A0A9W8KA85_9AGAR|nr:hypothetical protein NLJ89_g4046 [Agrocybe chaxingu]